MKEPKIKYGDEVKANGYGDEVFIVSYITQRIGTGDFEYIIQREKNGDWAQAVFDESELTKVDESGMQIAQDDADTLFVDFTIRNLGRAEPDVWGAMALIRRYEGKISSNTRGVMASIIRSWVANERNSSSTYGRRPTALRKWEGLAGELLAINQEMGNKEVKNDQVFQEA